MRTSKSSLLAALIAALCVSLVGATGAQAYVRSFDGYVDFDPALCKSGSASIRIIDYYREQVTGRLLDFSSLEPFIRTRPVGTATTTPARQYVQVRWGMRHWDHMGPGKNYDEWQGWKLAIANRYGTFEPFAYRVGLSAGTWWDTSNGGPSLDANGLGWRVQGSYYQNAHHTPLLEVNWYNPANSAQHVNEKYLVPLTSGYVSSCYLRPDGIQSSLNN